MSREKTQMIRLRLIAMAFSIALCIWLPTPVSAATIRAFLDGSEISYDVAPQFTQGRVMIPLRFTIRAITGRPAEWDQTTGIVDFTVGGHRFTIKVGERAVLVDGVKRFDMDAPAVIVGSRVLTPLRLIVAATGYSVDWDAANGYILITSPTGSAVPVSLPEIADDPQPADDLRPVSILSAVADKTSIKSGESVTLTVKTSGSANAVWVSYDGGSSAADYRSADASGVKTWTCRVVPSKTQALTVYANHMQSAAGAAKRSVSVTVAPAAVTIESASLSRTSIKPGESVVLSVKTSANANNVWVSCDGSNAIAEYQSADSRGVKTWAVTLSPSKTQTLTVCANTSTQESGAATRNLSITVTGAVVTIVEVAADKTTVSAAEPVTLTVRTSAGANNVWVVCDGKTVTAAYQSADDTGVKTWTATLSPSKTQTLTAYANTSQTTSGAATRTVAVTVTAQVVPSIPPEILNIYPFGNQTASAYRGGDVSIAGGAQTVYLDTNTVATAVWAVCDGNNVTASLLSNGSGYKRWALKFTPSVSQTVSFYANTSQKTDGAAMFDLKYGVYPKLATVIENFEVTRLGSGEPGDSEYAYEISFETPPLTAVHATISYDSGNTHRTIEDSEMNTGMTRDPMTGGNLKWGWFTIWLYGNQSSHDITLRVWGNDPVNFYDETKTITVVNP